MNKIKSVLILLIITVLLFTNTSIYAQGKLLRGVAYQEYNLDSKNVDFYVSTEGNDNWSGTLAEPNTNNTDGPFKTIAKAKQAVKELKRELYTLKEPPIDQRFKGSPHKFGAGRDILVLIREGFYPLENTLTFSPEDGGERVETNLPTGAFEYHKLKDYYVTYAAFPGEKPIISGGKEITGWKKGKKGKWSTELDHEISELFANGNRQTLARTPNEGFLTTPEQPTDPGFFKFYKDDLKAWKGLENNEITIVVRWSRYHGQISKVDEKKGIAYLNPPSEDILFVPPKYFVENVEALLDYPGEWFYNKKNKVLSYIPEEDVKNPNDAFIVTPTLSNLIHVTGTREQPVRNLRFYNLAFSTTSSGGQATVFFEYAKNCEVLKNTITNVSQAAIKFGLGSYHNTIKNNTIRDVAGVGIRVMGSSIPQNWADVVSDNTISYNKVTDINRAGGISAVNTLRTTISHNYVRNTGSYGITSGGWPNVEETSDANNLIEYNHVSFTNMGRDDEGGMAVYGLNPGSIVRYNVIHDVHFAETNENVGFFFQNMSSGWTVTDNIYYNLKQGEMKLCAAYPIDNVYEDNFVIETPLLEAEEIINSKPEFEYADLNITANEGFVTGSNISITAKVNNIGGTGLENVILYIDGKVAETQKFPVISKNTREIEFKYQFFDPGNHTVAIGGTAYKDVNISGDPLYLLYSDLQTPIVEVAEGTTIPIKIRVKNVRPDKEKHQINLLVDGKINATQEIEFEGGETKDLEFLLNGTIGNHAISVGDHPPINIRIYPLQKIDLTATGLSTYCSGTAKPCEFEYDEKQNHFEIIASGTDFLHAEDSYGTIYLNKSITGNFVATVKLIEFGKGVSEWFRAGIFVRNDITKSNETEKGSLGSFLMFSTPMRGGAEWDEFGGGNMHNTKSRNYNIENPFPVWLKLIRHGDKFTGYYSFDGTNWIFARESKNIPGLEQSIDIGLAAGTNDQKPSKVVFEDFKLWVEN